MYFYGPPYIAVQKQDDQHEHAFSSYVRIRDVDLKTCLGRWMIGRSGERGSGISVLPARHDDDDAFFSFCRDFSPCFLFDPKWCSHTVSNLSVAVQTILYLHDYWHRLQKIRYCYRGMLSGLLISEVYHLMGRWHHVH